MWSGLKNEYERWSMNGGHLYTSTRRWVMSDIRKCFTSRWRQGALLEVDYSQLEVVALATLTEDTQLIADLLSGTDMHRLRASQWLKKDPKDITDDERFNAKRLSFMLQYGSGAGNMAIQLKLPKAECKAFIEAFYSRYPQVKNWQDVIEDEVTASRVRHGHTKSGLPRGIGKYKSISGRAYTFYEYDHPFKEGEVGFSPTEMKNYPCQGFATGDIMKIALGNLNQAFWKNRDVLLINTVHDSMMLDINSTDHSLATSIMDTTSKALVDDTTRILKESYCIELAVPLQVDFKVGTSWYNMIDVIR
jgi:DNA polymerase I-like protein with 3'-5' exonuclease and polymerase domains